MLQIMRFVVVEKSSDLAYFTYILAYPSAILLAIAYARDRTSLQEFEQRSSLPFVGRHSVKLSEGQRSSAALSSPPSVASDLVVDDDDDGDDEGQPDPPLDPPLDPASNLSSASNSRSSSSYSPLPSFDALYPGGGGQLLVPLYQQGRRV